MAATKKKTSTRKPAAPAQRQTAVNTQRTTPERKVEASGVKCTVKKTFAFGNTVYKAGTEATFPEVVARKLKGYLTWQMNQ